MSKTQPRIYFNFEFVYICGIFRWNMTPIYFFIKEMVVSKLSKEYNLIVCQFFLLLGPLKGSNTSRLIGLMMFHIEEAKLIIDSTRERLSVQIILWMLINFSYRKLSFCFKSIKIVWCNIRLVFSCSRHLTSTCFIFFKYLERNAISPFKIKDNSYYF